MSTIRANVRDRYIDLGKDGSKWKHGYIPENPAAVALKDHKSPGGSGKTSEGLPGPKSKLPEGRKVSAHEVHGSMGEIRDAESGQIYSSGHTSKRAAARVANAHNLKIDQDAAAKEWSKVSATAAAKRKRSAAATVTKANKIPASALEGKDFRSMSNAEKIAAAEHMHGTGSKQHKAAIKKWA